MVVINGIGLGVFLCLAVRRALPSKENFSPFFAFLARTRPMPPFGIPRAFQPPKQNNIVIFLFIFVHIDSHSILCGPLIKFILKAAMSALLPCPSASAGKRRHHLPLSTLSSPPPLPPQSPPLSACHHYHRHCCHRCSVSAAIARCCRCCCHRRCHHCRHHFHF